MLQPFLRRRGAVLLTSLAVTLFLLPGACQDGATPAACGQIPGAGCPVGRGGTCADPTCDALYDCVNGAWTLKQACGDAGVGGKPDGGQDAGSDAACVKAVFDLSGETVGCQPGLQNPDCPIAAAETCLDSVCLTGCSDFWVCLAGGWKDLAYCDADNQLTLIK